MGTHWIDDVGVWLNDIDLSPYSDEVQLRFTREALVCTNFDSGGAVERMGGPFGIEWRIGGQNGFEDPDGALWDAIENQPAEPVLTICPEGKAAGDLAYIVQPRGLTREAVGEHGAVARYQLAGGGASTSSSLRGTNHGKGAVSLAKQTITGNVDGTGIQFPASNANVLFAVVHVFADNGTSLDVVLESDDNAGFTTPSTRHTFAVTGVGSQSTVWAMFLSASDDWFRLRAENLVGTNFELAGAICMLRL